MRVEISPELLVEMFREGNEIHARVHKGILPSAIFDGVCLNQKGNIVLIFSDPTDHIEVEIQNLETRV